MTRGGHRPGAGRPVHGDARDANLNVRVSRAKLEAWKEAAARDGMSMTEWTEAALDAAASPTPRKQGAP